MPINNESAKYTPEERREYAESIKNYWDYYSTMKTAADKGRAEGRAEGLVEGRAEGRAEGLVEGRTEGIEQTKRENARKMKARGYSVADIADITGLAPEDVEKL